MTVDHRWDEMGEKDKDRERRMRCIEVAAIVVGNTMKNAGIDEKVAAIVRHAKELYDFTTGQPTISREKE